MDTRQFIRMRVASLLRESSAPQVWYHGSDHKFDSFADFKSNGPSALGIFVTDDRNLAEVFGQYVYECQVSFSKAAKISMDKWDSIRDRHAKDTAYFSQMREQLISKGHDALLIGERSWTSSGGITLRDGNILVLFDKSQLRIIPQR